MKIGNDKYLCPWCGHVTKYKRFSVTAALNSNNSLPGRHTMTDGLVCKCGRLISQKTGRGSK